jgi:putative PIN family toxin of toxin-antitoxin system
MRMVLDTSVIVAAARSLTGASSVLLGMALRHEFQLLLSVPLLLEYEAVLTRADQLAAAGFSLRQMQSLLESIGEHATEVHLGFFRRVSARDEDDSHVLTLAVLGRADGLVTHNLRDFSDGAPNAGINLYTPADALRRLRR